MGIDSELDAEDAFTVLSNETRLAILRELAAVADEALTVRSEPIPYAELKDRVGVQDSGNFNYHLDGLCDRFVQRTDDGYRIRRAGLHIIRTVRAGNITIEQSVDRTVIDESCPYCGAAIATFVEDDWLFVACTDCPGMAADSRDVRDGLLSAQEVPPAAQRGRSTVDLFETIHVSTKRRVQMAFAGVCPECTGSVERTLVICDDHDTEDGGTCKVCGHQRPALARLQCDVCQYTGVVEPVFAILSDFSTRIKLHDAGVTVDGSPWAMTTQLVGWEYTIESEDEPTLHYRVPTDDGELSVWIDSDFGTRLSENVPK